MLVLGSWSPGVLESWGPACRVVFPKRLTVFGCSLSAQSVPDPGLRQGDDVDSCSMTSASQQGCVCMHGYSTMFQRSPSETPTDRQRSRSAAVSSLLGAVCGLLWFSFQCGLTSLNSCYNLSVQAETHLQSTFYGTLCSLRSSLGNKVVHLSPDQLEMDDDRCFTSLEEQQFNSSDVDWPTWVFSRKTFLIHGALG